MVQNLEKGKMKSKYWGWTRAPNSNVTDLGCIAWEGLSLVGPGRRVGSWPSPSPTSPLYSSLDSALLRLIIVSRSDPKEMEDVRERKEALMVLKIKEREGCHHCRARAKERGVRFWKGFEDSLNCCRVLEGERLEREIEIINVRDDRSFLLVFIMCAAHDLAYVSLFLFDICPCMQQLLQPCV